MNPSCFTFELLNSLKFKELQKLSIQFHVNKRWAKKHELIENLMSLKNSCKNNDEDWRNESSVFSNSEKCDYDNKETTVSSNKNENEYKIDRQLTFVISQKSNKLPAKAQRNNADVKNSYISDLNRTFTYSGDKTPPKVKNNYKKPLAKEKPIKKEVNLFNKNPYKKQEILEICEEKGSSTTFANKAYIRSSRKEKVGSQMTPDGSGLVRSTPKQCTTKPNSFRTPYLTKNDYKNISMLEQQNRKMMQPVKASVSKIPKKLNSSSFQAFKENVSYTMSAKKNLNENKPNQVKTMFSPGYQKMNSKVCLPLHKTPQNRNFTGVKNESTSRFPNSTNPPLTARKMPDFKKIHQKQFERMDSVVDYLKKKEERSKKLLGPSDYKMHRALQMVNNKTPVVNPPKIDKIHPNRSVFARAVQKESVKSKLPSIANRTEDIRNKNRSLINGVRMNKRFELQMKLRNG